MRLINAEQAVGLTDLEDDSTLPICTAYYDAESTMGIWCN